MRSNPKQNSTIFTEAICSILLGSVPCAIVVYTSGIESLISFLRSLTPPSAIVYYFMVLLLLHFFIWGANRFLYSPIEEVSIVKKRVLHLSDQVGYSLLGLYRTLAGALPMVFVPALIVEPTIENFQQSVLTIFLSAGSLFVACILSSWQLKTKLG